MGRKLCCERVLLFGQFIEEVKCVVTLYFTESRGHSEVHSRK